MNYIQIMHYLDHLEPKFYSLKKKDIGLEGISKLLGKIGNPHKGLKAIHVAGTKGKGSVCAFLSYMLAEAGYKVGLYLSPHVYDFRERIQINNRMIPEKDFTAMFNKIKPFITTQTYFEIITAIAFLYFTEQKVDFAIIETGMGGRFDATNVITPLISVITNIGIEHTEFLGNTLEKIAYEKAGIIKSNAPCITMASEKALNAIKNICKERDSKLFAVKGKDTNELIKKNVKLGLEGRFQYKNAALALKTIDVLSDYYSIKIKNKAAGLGLRKASLPGRFERIGKNIIADSAHTINSMKALADELSSKKLRDITFVIGFSKGKKVREIIKILEPLAKSFIITKADYFRALNPKEIARYAGKSYKIIKNVKKAIEYAKKTSKNKPIVVTGSVYVVGETKKSS